MNLMSEKQTFHKIGMETQNAFASIFLVANPLVWYYSINVLLQDVIAKSTSTDPSTAIIVWGMHYSGIIVSALAGALFTKKIDHNRFLTFWMIFGAISSLSVFFVYGLDVLSLSLIALLLGVSLGIGMPACMGYFTNTTPIEKRGRMSGMVILTFMLGMVIMTFLPYNILVVGGILAVWRLSSLLVFRLKPFKQSRSFESTQKEKIPAYKTILNQRAFIFYLVPWVMFSLVNYLTTPIQSELVVGQVPTYLMLLQNVSMGLFGVIGGFLLDRNGRRWVAVAGFVMIGIGTSIIAVFPKDPISWYICSVAGGISWGFLFIVFVLTIWGDLGGDYKSDKYYALGVAPFFASQFLATALGTYIADAVQPYALFSFTALFLFVAVLPLFLAPETLPEKAMKDRDLKSYLDKAQKIVQKEYEKNSKKETREKQEEPKESEEEIEDSLELVEAQKLAEKYY